MQFKMRFDWKTNVWKCDVLRRCAYIYICDAVHCNCKTCKKSRNVCSPFCSKFLRFETDASYNCLSFLVVVLLLHSFSENKNLVELSKKIPFVYERTNAHCKTFLSSSMYVSVMCGLDPGEPGNAGMGSIDGGGGIVGRSDV